jgi:AcrR family transcriptional regulator
MITDEINMEERILKAAEDLFLEQSFAKTTTGQIAKRAGCNQALVHYYYRTKENLFDRIFEEKARFLFTNIMQVETSEISFEEKIRKMVGTHFDFLRQNPRLVPFVLNEIMFDPARMQSLIDKLQQYPVSIFAQLELQLKSEIEHGNIRPISAIDLILTAVSLNVAPLLIIPILQKATNMSEDVIDGIMEQRKQETIETVLSRIRS